MINVLRKHEKKSNGNMELQHQLDKPNLDRNLENCNRLKSELYPCLVEKNKNKK